MNDDSIQRRLLSESRLDYAKAVETALNMETTAQSMKTLESKAEGLSTEGDSAAQPQVNKTSTKSGKSVPTCYRCGIRGHAVPKCRVDKNIICHHCQQRRHMQRACKSKNKSKDEAPAVGRVGEEESDSDDSNDSSLCIVESKGVVPPPIQVKVKLDDSGG